MHWFILTIECVCQTLSGDLFLNSGKIKEILMYYDIFTGYR